MLEFVSPDMQNNEDVVLAAIKEKGDSLYFANSHLIFNQMKDNKKLVKEAVISNTKRKNYQICIAKNEK